MRRNSWALNFRVAGFARVRFRSINLELLRVGLRPPTLTTHDPQAVSKSVERLRRRLVKVGRFLIPISDFDQSVFAEGSARKL